MFKKRRKWKCHLAVLLTLVMVMGVVPGTGGNFATVQAAGEITYIDENGEEQTLTETYVSVTDQTTWNAGWYVVDSDVTISSDIKFSGDVHLILKDGCKLTVNGGILGNVGAGDTLTIYGQSGQSGEVNVTASNSVGIGGQGTTITINGGRVIATSSAMYCGGIGVSGTESGVTVIINGGYVEVPSGSKGGTGIGGNGGNVSIHGGIVIANGGENAAGIGVTNVHITGGEITATGGMRGAGIGGGNNCSGGTILIEGGIVNATSNQFGAGIGGGAGSSGGNIIIKGGTVTAKGGEFGAGIGGGSDKPAGNITITGGTITATGGWRAADIGTGGGSTTDGSGTISIGGGVTIKNEGGNFPNIAGPVDGPTYNPTSLTLNQNELSLVVAGSDSLTTTIQPDWMVGRAKTVWSTSNDQIATVENGTVKAVALGEATITATIGDKSATCTVTVKNAGPAAPSVTGDYAVSSTDSSKFVYTVTPVTEAEYKMDNGTWQDSNVFDGIASGSTHTFYARIKETEDTYVGAEANSGAVQFSKLANLNVPPLKFLLSGKHGNRTITFAKVSGAEYSFDGGVSYGTSNVMNNVSGIINVAIRFAETDTLNPSTASTQEVNTDKTAQTSFAIDTIGTKTYGDEAFTLSVSGASGTGAVTYESSAPDILSISGDIATIHKAGIVMITAKIEEDDTYQEATATFTLTINRADQSKPAAPTIESHTENSVTLATIQTNANGAAVEYSKDNGASWQSSPVFTGLSGSVEYTFTVRYAEVEGRYTASDKSDVLQSSIPHNLIHHEAKEPTYTEVGWKAYDECKDCDYTTYVEIPKLVEYKITEGANQTIKENYDGTVTITCDGELSKFVSVSVDGNKVDSKNYTVKSSSTILTFTKEYVDSLAVGTHTVRFEYTDGFVETNLTIAKAEVTDDNQDTNKDDTDKENTQDTDKDDTDKTESTTEEKPAESAKTGDGTPFGLLIVFFITSLVGLSLLEVLRRKRDSFEEK